MSDNPTKILGKPKNDPNATKITTPPASGGLPKPPVAPGNDIAKPTGSHHVAPKVSPAGRTEQIKQINADIAKRPPPAGATPMPSSAPTNPAKKFSIMDRLKSKGSQIQSSVGKFLEKRKRAGQIKQINTSIQQTKAQSSAAMPGINSKFVGKSEIVKSTPEEFMAQERASRTPESIAAKRKQLLEQVKLQQRPQAAPVATAAPKQPQIAQKTAIPQPSAPSAGAHHQMVLNALSSLHKENPNEPLFTTGQLRSKTNLPKEHFDQAALDLTKQGKISLHRHDYPAGLNETDKHNLVHDSGHGMHYIGVALRKSNIGKNEMYLLDILKAVGVPKKGIGPEAHAKMKQENDAFLAAQASKQQGLPSPKPQATLPPINNPKPVIASPVQVPPHVEAATRQVKSHANHGSIMTNMKKVSAPKQVATPLAHPLPEHHAVKSPENQERFAGKNNIIPKERAPQTSAMPAMASKSKIIPKGSQQNNQALAAQDKKKFESEKTAPLEQDIHPSWETPSKDKEATLEATHESNKQNTPSNGTKSPAAPVAPPRSVSGQQQNTPNVVQKQNSAPAAKASGQPLTAPPSSESQGNVNTKSSMKTQDIGVKHQVAPEQKAHSHLISFLQNLVNPAAQSEPVVRHSQHFMGKSIDFATPEQKATRTSAHETKQHQKLLDLKDKKEDVKKPEHNRNKLLTVIKNCGSMVKP